MTDPTLWLEMLASTNPDIRHSAKLAIGGLSPSDDVLIDPFISALGAENDDLVFWAITGLGCLEKKAADAVEQISSLGVQHPAFGIRQSAIHSLSKIAPNAPLSVTAITQALADENPFVRRQALQACIAFNTHSTELLQRIESLAGDNDESVASWSGVALRNIRLKATL